MGSILGVIAVSRAAICYLPLKYVFPGVGISCIYLDEVFRMNFWQEYVIKSTLNQSFY